MNRVFLQKLGKEYGYKLVYDDLASNQRPVEEEIIDVPARQVSPAIPLPQSHIPAQSTCSNVPMPIPYYPKPTPTFRNQIILKKWEDFKADSIPSQQYESKLTSPSPFSD